MEKEIVIKGMILKNFELGQTLKEIIKKFIEQKKDLTGFNNNMIFQFKEVDYFCIIYQTKTKIFVQFRNKELENI